MQPAPAEPAIETIAAEFGIVDALLFRRVSTSTWAHLGGFGRGRAWAGIVDVDDLDDPLVAKIPSRPGGVHTVAHDTGSRVLGPYYARGGALVRVSNDVVVILANPTDTLAPSTTLAQLRALADLVQGSVEDVSPSKRLGDELEVLHAVRATITVPVTSLDGTLDHIVRVAVDALSCEVGVLRDGARRTAQVSPSNRLGADQARLAAALDELENHAADGAFCLQDVDADSALLLLDLGLDIRSVLVVTIPQPVGGILVAAHTGAGPRGFTSLCQRLAAQVADAASVIAHTAALRDHLGTVADVQYRTARTDALTGLGNRLCWEESLAIAQNRVDAGAEATVITLDIDGLKEINDTYGHDAGDELLRRCAEILRDYSRDGDVVARLGGDEFAMLLPVDSRLGAQRLAALCGRFGQPTSGQHVVAASVGAGTAERGQRVADAVRDADASMYAQKRSRRAHGRGVIRPRTAVYGPLHPTPS